MLFFAVGVDEGDGGVRVDDARHAKVLPDALLAALVLRFHSAGDLESGELLGPVLQHPRNALLVGFHRLVRLGVKAQQHLDGRGFSGDFGAHPGRPAGGELAVHHDPGDADALLPSRLTDGVEAGTEQQLPEDLRDVVPRNTRAVVLHFKFEHVALDVHLADLNADVRQDARFFARIERVVHRFLHRGDEGAMKAVKTEEVLVFLEELGNGGLLLVVR